MSSATPSTRKRQSVPFSPPSLPSKPTEDNKKDPKKPTEQENKRQSQPKKPLRGHQTDKRDVNPVLLVAGALALFGVVLYFALGSGGDTPSADSDPSPYPPSTSPLRTRLEEPGLEAHLENELSVSISGQRFAIQRLGSALISAVQSSESAASVHISGLNVEEKKQIVSNIAKIFLREEMQRGVLNIGRETFAESGGNLGVRQRILEHLSEHSPALLVCNTTELSPGEIFVLEEFLTESTLRINADDKIQLSHSLVLFLSDLDFACSSDKALSYAEITRQMKEKSRQRWNRAAFVGRIHHHIPLLHPSSNCHSLLS